MIQLTHITAKVLNLLPVNYKNLLFEVALNYLPLWLIKMIPCSYSSYLNCYFPEKGDVVIDCGANIGNCTLLFSRCVGKEGLVIALEPLEGSFDILTNRMKRLRNKNIVAINKGVWNDNGIFLLKVFSNPLSCKIEKAVNPVIQKNHCIHINCITIDELMDELELRRLDMIKMDIEGAEIEALQGSENTLKYYHPHVAVASYHKKNNKPACHEVENFLNNRGYVTRTFFPPHLTTCGKKVNPK